MDIKLENVTPGRTGHLRLVPNINRSGRALPESVSSDDLKNNTKTDEEMPTRRLSDKEIYSLMIGVSDEEAKANPKLTLEVTYNPTLFQVLNASGIPLAGQATQPFTLDLDQAIKDGTKSRGVQFFIEAQTFAGSPLLDPKASVTMAFRILDGNGTALLTQPTFSGSDIRTADLILVGDDAPPERVFMCDVAENGPSISEFTDAAKAAGVPLTIIPIDVGNGDSWIQDQFQIGYTGTPQASQRVILHLPRMTNDSAILAGAPNLRNFVDTYFPSNDVGVVKDLWKITVSASDGSVSATFDLAESYLPYKQLSLVPMLLRKMTQLLFQADPKAQVTLPPDEDIFARRLAIDQLAAQLATYRNVKPDVLARIAEVKPTVDRLSNIVFVKDQSVGVNLLVKGEKKTLIFSPDPNTPSGQFPTNKALNIFWRSLSDVHDSGNYGGNIEVSPPTSDAPYGKILAGSVSAKALSDFLTSRGALHPLVTVFTQWLEVGHIDEIAAFAPLPSKGFCLLRASPKLALSMLDQVAAMQAKGTLVTKLFRGKKWIHKQSARATDPMPPPNSYVRLLKEGPYDLSAFDKQTPKSANPVYGDAAYHDDRQFLVLNRMVDVDAQYAAMISCADLLSLCRVANRTVEDLFLANTFAYADDPTYARYYNAPGFQKDVLPFRLDKAVGDAFPDTKLFSLPVLFDHIGSFLIGKVSAIVPAVVNFQTLGNYVMVPRPYGPRLRVPDAATVVNNVTAKLGYPKVTIDEKYIRTRGLDKTWHWTRAAERVSHASLSNIPTEFDKNFQEFKTLKARSMYQTNPFGELADAFAPWPYLDLWAIQHANDPLQNHPVSETETLYRIAGYFKDGFDAFKNYPVDFCKGDTEKAHPLSDKYESDIKAVMEKINTANPGVFDKDGSVIPKDWTRIAIPEDTTDVFELYTQALMESLGLTVRWIDSWYYHTHKGGIHCGTNVLRTFTGNAQGQGT